MTLLGLLSGLYHLQLSGAFIGILGNDLHAFVKLNASMTVVLGCASLFACAKVLASPRFKLLYMRGFYALLGGSLLMTALGSTTSQSAFNLAALSGPADENASWSVSTAMMSFHFVTDQ